MKLFYSMLLFLFIIYGVFSQDANDFIFTINNLENLQTITINGYRGNILNIINQDKIIDIPVVEIKFNDYQTFLFLQQ